MPSPARIDFRNNLYADSDVVPADFPIEDGSPIVGDPGFAKRGGFKLEDYIPANVEWVRDKGIAPVKLPGDPVGLTLGLEVETDILGNPVVGRPDLGAIEIAE